MDSAKNDPFPEAVAYYAVRRQMDSTDNDPFPKAVMYYADASFCRINDNQEKRNEAAEAKMSSNAMISHEAQKISESVKL